MLVLCRLDLPGLLQLRHRLHHGQAAGGGGTPQVHHLPPPSPPSLFRSDPKPWSELVAADVDTENWVVTLRPRQTGDDWRKMIRTIAGGKFTIGRAH